MRISSIPTCRRCSGPLCRSEEHTSELHHLVISYAVFCLKKKKLVGWSGRRRVCPASRAPATVRGEGVILCASLAPFLFFFNDPATTEIYPLSLHDALPI